MTSEVGILTLLKPQLGDVLRTAEIPESGSVTPFLPPLFFARTVSHHQTTCSLALDDMCVHHASHSNEELAAVVWNV